MKWKLVILIGLVVVALIVRRVTWKVPEMHRYGFSQLRSEFPQPHLDPDTWLQSPGPVDLRPLELIPTVRTKA